MNLFDSLPDVTSEEVSDNILQTPNLPNVNSELEFFSHTENDLIFSIMPVIDDNTPSIELSNDLPILPIDEIFTDIPTENDLFDNGICTIMPISDDFIIGDNLSKIAFGGFYGDIVPSDTPNNEPLDDIFTIMPICDDTQYPINLEDDIFFQMPLIADTPVDETNIPEIFFPIDNLADNLVQNICGLSDEPQIAICGFPILEPVIDILVC